jgi:hypothetical protein
MFSKLLIKLIDQSIMPAILLISTRVISIILYSKSKNINFGFDSSGFTFRNTADYTFVNSYSTLFMIAALTIGLVYILVKAYVFHESHITPKTTAEIFSLKLHGLIQSSFTLYTQGTIWLSYLFFIAMASGLMAYYGILFTWVFYISISICVIMSVLFILDVENEIKITNTSAFAREDDSEE